MNEIDDRASGLLAWQWALYAQGHRDRKNLIVHVLTVPFFLAGTLVLVASPLVAWWLAPLGLVGMVAAVASQGRGHAREATAPVAFRGAADVAARIFVEQWITFPRYVLTGRFSEAWRQAR